MTEQHMPKKPCSALAHLAGRLVIRLSGWRVAGQLPDSDRMLVIAAPHTSNWDLIYLLAAAFSFHLPINYLIKHTVFVPVLGSILRFFGGIPVDRRQSNNLVDDLANTIREAEQFALVVPPSGTRKYTPYWKSGFYQIALAADIPVVCGYLDYRKKEAGLGLSFKLTGDMTADMDRIREFYADITAKYPDHKSRIMLRQEDESVVENDNAAGNAS